MGQQKEEEIKMGTCLRVIVAVWVLVAFFIVFFTVDGWAESPEEMLKDQYSAEFTNALQKEQWNEALGYIKKLDDIGEEMPPSFEFFRGKTLYHLDRYKEAQDALTRYSSKAGIEGKHYKEALNLLNIVEKKLTAEEKKRASIIRSLKNGKHFVQVSGGCFEMGDTFGDGDSTEKPVHEVCVDDFYMGKHEVTQGEWWAVMGSNPSFFRDCDDCPVERVSWNDVQKFIGKLNELTGRRHRLPTEAEWEYAAREGGKKVRFGTGKDTIGADDANFDAREKYKKPYSQTGEHRGKTTQVGSFKPNTLGLFDMSGNVWEWVQDWYDSDYYKSSPRQNPGGPSSGDGRVLRGGSWDFNPWYIRVAYRSKDMPDIRISLYGFRLVLSGHD